MRREETPVERVGSNNAVAGGDRDGPPPLRIAGYVAGHSEGRAEEEIERRTAGLTLPNISDYWPDSPQQRKRATADQQATPGWQVFLPSTDRPIRPRVTTEP